MIRTKAPQVALVLSTEAVLRLKSISLGVYSGRNESRSGTIRGDSCTQTIGSQSEVLLLFL